MSMYIICPPTGYHQAQRGQEPRHVASDRWGPLQYTAAGGGRLERAAALPAGGIAAPELAARGAAGVRAGPAGLLEHSGPVVPGRACGAEEQIGRAHV